MTNLSYQIGNINTTSYAEAVQIAKEMGLHIEKVYNAVEENVDADAIKRAKRIAAMRNRTREMAQ